MGEPGVGREAMAFEQEIVVSVVIPTRNRADLLRGAIESVLRQHDGPLQADGALEVIVVDDASTDDTADVIARYAPLVRGIRNGYNLERGASRNIGAAAARGAWIAFLDSDDEWEDGKLAAQLEAVGGNDACTTGRWLIGPDGSLLGRGKLGPHDARSVIDTFNPYHAAPSSLLIRRTVFHEVGGFPEEPEVQGSEDWVFMAMLLHHGCRPVELTHPFVRYRIHPDNSTADPSSYLRSSLAAVAYLERIGVTSSVRAKRARAQKFDVAARGYALRGERLAAVRCLMMALQAAPDGTRTGLVTNTAVAGIQAATRTGKRALLKGRRVL